MFHHTEMKSGTARRNLHEQIADDIGSQIVKSVYREHDVLPTELMIAERYHASRTAVREAFRILIAKGMIHSRPKVGTKVRARADWNMLDADVLSWHLRESLDLPFLSSVFEMRLSIEPQAAAFAARRRNERHLRTMATALQTMQQPDIRQDAIVAADVEFHKALLDASENPMFRSLGPLLEALLAFHPAACLPALRRAYGVAIDAAHPSLMRHNEVFAAIQDRDETLAASEMAGLITATAEECLRVLGRAQPVLVSIAG